MVDQQRLLGIRSDVFSDVSLELPDPSSIEIELGELADPLAAHHSGRELALGDKARAELAARIERAQAARGARLVRAAGEAVPNAPAPAVSPDTVWSGDFGTLVNLVQYGLRRERNQFVISGCVIESRHNVNLRARRTGRTHEQP